MTTTCLEVYAPLQEFNWNGLIFKLSSDILIKQFDKMPDLRGLNSKLSWDEQQTLSEVRHWLTFKWREMDDPCPAEIVNITLLSLWLTKPNRTNIPFRFELSQKPEADQRSIVRLLDRFAWIPDIVDFQFEDTDLNNAATYFPLLCAICQARGRLNNPLYLTLAGCYSHQWQSALICFAAATEAILSFDSSRGITRRLATLYACLVEKQEKERDNAFREFFKLYNVRSDIIHGRTHNIPSINRLPTLARFGDLLRRLWRVVLLSSEIRVFEGSDAERKKYFLALQSGYKPPPM